VRRNAQILAAIAGGLVDRESVLSYVDGVLHLVRPVADNFDGHGRLQ
jgi:hypothetical protein